MFGNLGLPEILIILVLILLLFGAKRIPEIAGSFGKGITEFKRNMGDAQRQIMDPVREEPRVIAQERAAPVVTPAAAPLPAEEEAARQPKRLIG
jgi:sec-independent protein translocase protein TatA